MMRLLADSAPSGTDVWLVIGAAAVLASIVGNYAQWVMARRKRENVLIQNQPLDVRMISDLVRKDDCVGRHMESAAAIAKMERALDELRRERVEDARAAAFSRKGMYDTMKGLSTEMRDMPDRIVAQLLNTKKLWEQ